MAAPSPTEAGAPVRALVTAEGLAFDAWREDPADGAAPRELIVLLHGYAERGERILRKLRAALPPGATVLAPNGPFPLPEKVGDRYRVGYAWYFYDRARDEYLVDPAFATAFLRAGIARLGLAHLPCRIVGFSQGGYLAPFAALALPGVRQVVAIASRYLVDELGARGEPSFPGSRGIRFDGVHGDADAVVDAAEARASHAELRAAGAEGRFRLLAGVDHRITPAVAAAVGELLGDLDPAPVR